MRKILGLFLVFSVLFYGSAVTARADGAKPSGKVIVYYFHTAFRCYSCTLIEQYSREAVEGNFKEALASGKLEFKAVNVEERVNEHFISDYQLYTKSLIISLVKDGKEIKSKNLTMIWQYGSNKQRFLDYVAGEVSAFLKEVS